MTSLDLLEMQYPGASSSPPKSAFLLIINTIATYLVCPLRWRNTSLKHWLSHVAAHWESKKIELPGSLALGPTDLVGVSCGLDMVPFGSPGDSSIQQKLRTPDSKTSNHCVNT